MSIIAVPSKGNGGLNEPIIKRFGKSESITIVSLKEKKITSVKAVPIRTTGVAGNLGTYVASIVKDNNASITLVQFIGSKAFKSLESQGMVIFQIVGEGLLVKQCVEMYIQDKLTRLTNSNSHLIKD
ncbi:MAG: NifB/NifX family molybdenum-iron cluster-binding protein [Candidatus Lokiarchaeota archaeon]|nr:NifB/NifX family molybdenum-iron cluster-binding protein [Candidatus Lokiarchaeota archaeon]